MLKKPVLSTFLSLLIGTFFCFAQPNNEFDTYNKVDEIMSREMEADAHFKNGAMSVYHKFGKKNTTVTLGFKTV